MELPLHPKLIHLPIALAILMPVFTVVLWVAIRRAWLPLRAWWLAVGAQVLLVASSFVAMSTGESAEERVERVVPEQAIERHAEAAELFTWTAVGVLAIGLLPLLLRRKPGAVTIATAATVLGSVTVLFLGYQVGQAGGELVYRYGAAAAYADPAGNLPVGETPTGKVGAAREADEVEEH